MPYNIEYDTRNMFKCKGNRILKNDFQTVENKLQSVVFTLEPCGSLSIISPFREKAESVFE